MTAVVFGVIVVMWAVVLIPMWLRRHDETEETRSVDRFSQAMHTLSRREAAAKEKKYAVMPTRTRRHEVHVSGASAEGRRTPLHRRVRTAATAASTASAAERRRRTFAVVLAITVLTLMLAVFMGGVAFWGLQVVVDFVVVAFVVHLRRIARHAALIRPSGRSSRRPIARPAVRYEPVYQDDDVVDDEYDEYDEYDLDEDDFEPVPVRYTRPAQAIFDQTVIEDPEIDYAPVATAAVFDQDTVYAEQSSDGAALAEPRRAVAVFDQLEVDEPVVAEKGPSYDAFGRDTEIDIPIEAPVRRPPARGVAAGIAADSGIGSRPWEPVPVPKPIYASKPAAPARSTRAPMFDPLLPPVETAAELDPVDDLEEILDRRWAVND